jgi:hypothetical protein
MNDHLAPCRKCGSTYIRRDEGAQARGYCPHPGSDPRPGSRPDVRTRTEGEMSYKPGFHVVIRSHHVSGPHRTVADARQNIHTYTRDAELVQITAVTTSEPRTPPPPPSPAPTQCLVHPDREAVDPAFPLCVECDR